MPDLGLYGPLIALAILILAIFARDGSRVGSGKAFPSFGKATLGAIVIFVIVLAGLILWNLKSASYEGGLPAVLVSFVGGAFAAWLSCWLGEAPGQAGSSRTAPIALAALTVSCLELFGTNAPLAAVFGCAAAAWLMGIKTESHGSAWAVRTTIYILAIYACDALALQLSPPIHDLGVLLALAAVIAGIIGLGIGFALSKRDSKLGFVGPVLAFALLSIGGYLIFRRNAMDSIALVAYVFAAILASLICWIIAEPDRAPGSQRGDGASVARLAIGAVLWVALATVVFGYGKTLGMAIALAGACFMTGLLGMNRAFLALGPLGALVIYRLFRILHPETAVAFDIGQHYALIGFLLGVMIPILAIEWERSAHSLKAANAWSSGILWVLLIAAAPVPIAVTLSDKGIIGYLVGLGLAPILDALRGASHAKSLSLSLGLSCAMVFLYGWLSPYIDMDRPTKLHALIWILSIMAVAAIVIAILSRSATSTPNELEGPAKRSPGQALEAEA